MIYHFNFRSPSIIFKFVTSLINSFTTEISASQYLNIRLSLKEVLNLIGSDLNIELRQLQLNVTEKIRST